MRISKKYAGKSIGKHVFLSRISSLSNHRSGAVTGGLIGSNGHLNGHLSGTGGIPPSTQSDLEKIRDLEFRFHMSLLQEGAACALGQNIGKTLSSRGSSSSNSIAARVKMNVAGVMNHPSG